MSMPSSNRKQPSAPQKGGKDDAKARKNAKPWSPQTKVNDGIHKEHQGTDMLNSEDKGTGSRN